MIKNFILLLLINIILTQELPNDVRWVIKSNEYKAICNQTYKYASIRLKKILKNYNGKEKLAVIMDLNETVLDNSQYQIELIENNSSFSMKSWSKWVEKEIANTVPGSINYIKELRENNIQIIFLSNRMHERFYRITGG